MRFCRQPSSEARLHRWENQRMLRSFIVGLYSGSRTCLYEELVADARVVDVVNGRREDDGERLEVCHDVL